MHKLFILLLIGLASSAVSSAETPSDKKATYVICVAAIAIIATKMEPGIFADSMKSEAQRHAKLARKSGASENDLSQAIIAIQLAYNKGEWSWEKITDLGQSCSKVK